MSRRFANRAEAGRLLAEELLALRLTEPVVLALPRGGVPVGLEVARLLHAPMDLLFVRKIGAPGHAEYGIGAVVDGTPPQVVINEALAHSVGASSEYIRHQVDREVQEIARHRSLYRTGPAVALAGRTVIVVDDGIATGGTVRAALEALHRSEARRIVLAVPVSPRDAIEALAPLCDHVVCLETPSPFHAVGAHYVDFTQTTDAEVIDAMHAAQECAHAP
ncbi:phosphoribosyltransferase [Tsuneonella deserti]|uniref:Phosphoribosyltransferase n=1 Tax=Tsuneonella deserti TaxID=2035528 RepID=A0ABQ1RZU2_9SPHN|nr:phosphoribosyltransferase family protein [Tsuneonella deserti]GGD86300.1 phosphoribosyltransferase [Tsuneonella deserti]